MNRAQHTWAEGARACAAAIKMARMVNGTELEIKPFAYSATISTEDVASAGTVATVATAAISLFMLLFEYDQFNHKN